MDRFEAMEIFTRVVEANSFTKVSESLDLPRAKEGGLDAQVFSIWCGAQYGKGQAFKYANREIDSLEDPAGSVSLRVPIR